MEQSFTLFRVRGIPIGANWSWLFVAAFFVFSFATALFPTTYPGLPGTTYLLMAVVTVALFFGSLLLHELGHAFRALREGMKIEGITLWLFGGVARFQGMFPSAGAEFRIAIAGPLVTAVLAAGFFVVGLLLRGAGAANAVVGVPDYLARVNLLLLGFNLIPALPLDGGRVYRAWLWRRTGSFLEATARAARTARAVSGAMIAIGILLVLSGDAGGGLWLTLISLFVYQASGAEAAYALFRQALSGVRVADVMTPNPETVDLHRTVASLFDEVARYRGHASYPVVDLGRFVGLVPLEVAARVPEERRPATTVGEVMIPRHAVHVVSPEDELTQVAPVLRGGPDRAVVLEGDRVSGIVAPSDIGRAVELGRLRRPPAPPQRRRTHPLVWVAVVLAGLALVGFRYTPPIAVIAPGEAFDISKDISISGVKTYPVHGKILLTSVSVSRPNVFGLVAALFEEPREFAPLSAIVPPGVNEREFFREQQAEFAQSEQYAAAAAAQAAGLRVRFSGGGARIEQIVPGSPASQALRRGDVITAVNGEPVQISQDLARAIRSRPAGTLFDITVIRGGRTVHVEVRSAASLGGPAGQQTGPAIGVLFTTQALRIDLPFNIRFKKFDIGGPSAGSAYALAVFDLLTPADVARGRSIAVTGTIDPQGRIGPIGGIIEKAAAVRRAGATIFVVPSSEASHVSVPGLRVIGVDTLEEAVRRLS